MEVRCYIHDAKQLRWAVIGVEDARMAIYVEMSMLQCRQLSEILSGDGKWKWTAHIATGSLLPVATDGGQGEERRCRGCGPSVHFSMASPCLRSTLIRLTLTKGVSNFHRLPRARCEPPGHFI